jgi:triosephosphate isomerase
LVTTAFYAPSSSSKCSSNKNPATLALNEYSSPLRNNNIGRETRAYFEYTSTSPSLPPRGPARLLPSSKHLLSNNEGNLFGREYPRTGGGGGATYNYHSNSYHHGGKNIADATSFRDGSASAWATIPPLSSLSSLPELSRITAPAASTTSHPPSKQYAIGSWKTPSPSSLTLPSLNNNNNNNNNNDKQLVRRRPIVAGNWKCNPATRSEAITLLRLLAANFINHRTTYPATTPSTTTTDDDVAANEVQLQTPEMVLFIPYPYLSDAITILEGTGIQVGVQTVSYITTNTIGPYTGEVTTSMVSSMGCTYVLLGHSERRILYGETNQYVNTMLHNCLSSNNDDGLKIILCVGETLEEYNSGRMAEVITTQLYECLANIDPSKHNILHHDRLLIAYEPIWAIGTGYVATPSQAQLAHETIRQTLYTIFDHPPSSGGGGGMVSNTVRILYGGSVTPDSVESLVSMEDVDGTLVGGASLNSDSFTRIFDGTVTATTSKMMMKKASVD